MRNTHIFRIEKNKNYTIMSNHHLNNKKLSWKAKGLHSYILSKPDSWKVVIKHLINASRDGESSVRTGIEELYNQRYWQKYPVYIEQKISHWETIVYEVPYAPDEEIKNIKYNNNQKIIEYKNGKIQKSSLQHKENQLLGENLEVGNLKVENLEVGNQGLISTDMLLNTDVSKYSVNQSSKIENKKNLPTDMTDRQTDNNTQKEFYSIIEKAQLNLYDTQSRQLLKDAIYNLLLMDELELNNTVYNKQQIRNCLNKLNLQHCDYALNKYRNALKEDYIKNPLRYFITILFNSVREESAIQFNPYL